MTVCYFGDYDPEHNRTKLLIRGLELMGVRVERCFVERNSSFRYLKIIVQYLKLRIRYDAMVLGHSDSHFMPLIARLLAPHKRIIWDIQFSYYDNWVFDRKLVREGSLKAHYHWLADWFNCRIVDRVILDTRTHFTYFVEEFGVNPAKMVQVASSADTDVFYPREGRARDGKLRVEYHGKYIPVQGVDVVLRAAGLLLNDPDISFTLIGNGQERKRMEALAEELALTNVEFLPFMPLSRLPPYIAEADVCIGLIGDIPRVRLTIANKLYEAAAMGRVSINADVPAIRELFTDGVDVVLIPQGNAEVLAEKLRYLKAHKEEVQELGKAAYRTFKEKCSPMSVGTQLERGIKQMLGA
jgi:glycosyltransferase involved in cell wall biosynthesis